MGPHIYCIVPCGVSPDTGLTGIRGAPVAAADVASVGIWYSMHDARPAVDAAAVLVHNAVIEAGMTSEVTPVPVRFGQWFDDLDVALDRLAADEAKWAADLARFAGCVEYGVRVLAETMPDSARDVRPAEADSGKEYMARLAQRHALAENRRAEGDAVAAQLRHTLADVIVAAQIELLATGGLLSCAFLVARQRAADYHAALAQVRRSRSDLDFLFTGPWPPYSFVA